MYASKLNPVLVKETVSLRKKKNSVKLSMMIWRYTENIPPINVRWRMTHKVNCTEEQTECIGVKCLKKVS